MNRVYLDTVGLIALLDNADQWHTVAESAYRQLTAQRVEFVTTSFVLMLSQSQ